MKKQITALAVIMAMLCLVIYVPTSAAAVTEVDTAAVSHHETFKALGIINNRVSNYNSTVKRSAYIQFLIELSGFEPNEIVGSSYVLPYSDIKSSDAFYPYVAAAYELGYLDTLETELRPSEMVTVGEAAEMLISLLGYSDAAKMSGIEGALMAKKLGLLKGVDGAFTDKLTYAGLFNMFYEALFTEVLEPERFGAKYIRYSEGAILLNLAFDVFYDRGVVEANPVTSVYATTGCEMGCIRIADVEYKADPSLYDYIGQRCEFLYVDNDGTLEMLYIWEEDAENVFTVSTDDLSALKKTSLSYYNESGRVKEKRIDASAAFLYNGKLKKFDTIPTEELSGTITLIDSDYDGVADTVSIVSYTHIVVRGIDYDKMIVMGPEAAQKYNFEPEPTKRVAEIYSEDEQIAFEDIKIGDVMSVAQSDIDKGIIMIRARICSDSVTGSVLAVTEDTVTVNDERYEFEKGYIDPKVGAYGVFRFAYNGKIVDAELENYTVYGFIYGMKSEKFGGGRAKIFTDNGRWVELDMAKRITYNGERKTISEIMGAAELNEEGEFKPQLISYRVNSKGQLSRLDTAKTVERYSASDKEAIKNGTFRLSEHKASSTFRNILNSFDLEIMLNSNTYIFVIPEKDGKIQADKLYLGRPNSFTADRTYNNIDFYDVTETGVCRAMVIHGNVESQSWSNPIYLVMGQAQMVDDDGNVTNALALMSDGKEVMIGVDEGAIPEGTQVGAGDIIRGTIGHDGKFNAIEVMFRGTNTWSEAMDSSNAYLSNYISGEIEYVMEDGKNIIVRIGDVRAVCNITDYISNVYSYNRERNIATVLEKTALATGQRIFARSRYGRFYDVIVFED